MMPLKGVVSTAYLRPTDGSRALPLKGPFLAARPEGANHQWRKNPPGELSIDPVADEACAVTAWVGAS